MKIIKSPFVRLGIKYGAIGGVFAILMFFILVMMGKIPMISIRLFDFILIPSFLFLAVKEFKDYYNNRELRFWQGMTVSFFTYTVIGAISGLFIYIYLTYFNNDLFLEFVTHELEKINLNKELIVNQMGEDTYADLVSSMESSEVKHSAWDDFLKKGLVGLFISPVISLFMRTNFRK